MSNIQEKIKIALELKHECWELAMQFAKLMGNSLYSDIVFVEEGFRFSYGPTAHGIGNFFTIPYDVLSKPELLPAIVQEERARIEEHRRKNLCGTCGQFKAWAVL